MNKMVKCECGHTHDCTATGIDHTTKIELENVALRTAIQLTVTSLREIADVLERVGLRNGS